MIRPGTYKVGVCGACNFGTVTYSERHKTPRCELCGHVYPELERARVQPSRLTGVLCAECETFTERPVKGLCPKCSAKRERMRRMYLRNEDGRHATEAPVGIRTLGEAAPS